MHRFGSSSPLVLVALSDSAKALAAVERAGARGRRVSSDEELMALAAEGADLILLGARSVGLLPGLQAAAPIPALVCADPPDLAAIERAVANLRPASPNELDERVRILAMLRESDDRYRTLFESVDQGFCVIEVMFDAEDRPLDYRFLECNPLFESQTGLVGALGRTAREMVPDLDWSWFEIYGRVALTGEAVAFENHAPAMGRWFDVRAQRVGEPEQRRVALLFRDITERKKAEEALRISERRLTRLFETNLLGILYWDMEGGVHDANDAFLEVVGYTREDLQAGAIDWVAMTPPEYAAQDAIAVESLRSTGLHAPIEKEYVRKDGERVWVLVGSAITEGDQGVGFVLPIGAQKRATQAAEAERRLLDAILDAAPVGIVVADAAGSIVRANPANLAIWGPDPYATGLDERGEWKAWWADGSERDGRRVAPDEWALARALRGEPARRDFVAIQAFDAPGSRRTMMNSGAAVRDASGAIVGAVVAQMDITARLEAEAGLREREERLRYALAATRAVTYELSAGSDVWIRSETSWEVLGIGERGTHEEFLAIVHPEDRDAVATGMRRAFAEDLRYDLSFRILRPDTGATRWMSLQGRVERDATGQPERTSGILTDVTERRIAEEQAQAAQRIEALGRLAGGVAHEINNALSGVLGFSDLALRGLGPDHPQRHTLEQISRAGKRAAGVTQQLLAFGRRQVLQLRDTDVAAVVRRFEPMLRQALGPDKALVLDVPDAPAVAHVDPGQVEQVLLNLALNARDAMGYGGRLAVRVSVERLAAERPAGFESAGHGPWVCLTVTDDGSGMTAAVQARLFEPFFTTKPIGKGTGLGLATVYGIVSQSRGHVAVVSAPGAGTTFRVLLPHIEAAPAAEPALQALLATVPTVVDARILVVEDEPIVREAILLMLEARGYDAVGASSVSEAISLLSLLPGPWHLIISDLVMPGESGASLAMRLRASHPDVPLLFVSGYTNDEAIRQGLLPGGATFLQKPIDMDALLGRVAELLRASADSQRVASR